ncbi:PilC/PilY family type IV pilus protein [Stenotrophomonas sp. BIGb0135]|uniref:pilus assembly protein n=1 Tax=Stenotrophomonas sp. BIGb0135 TaxID=2940620 RepID=UPI0021680484|nr:PilC/PilY family type IV pilus protein [Stenotrophomonas sp. BIGb0135]MCS4234225.1 type IV pilus assembly protein PilY1 [Stenotrophomonas sp. BIGb0135]
MLTRKTKIVTGSGLLLVAGAGWLAYSLFAAQAQGTLSQIPMNVKVSATPSFIMAVDDSGSMTFQTQFPGQDGTACWSNTRQSFFTANGALNTPDTIKNSSGSTQGECSYFYVAPGPRIGMTYFGLPALDAYGFARSAAYNPTYFDPSVKYEPWLGVFTTGGRETIASYGDAATGKTRIDPRQTATLDLTAKYLSSTATDAVRMQNGMKIPAGTQYYPITVNNNRYTVGNLNTNRNGVTWNSGPAYALVEYTPSTFYMPWTGTDDPRPAMAGDATVYSGVTREKINDACGTNCHMWKYTIASGNTAALQNFANWFSYYGNRNRAMIAGMTRAMDVNNMYVGYFKINDNGSYDSSTDSGKRLAIQNMGTPADKIALYKKMIALTASGGTPNRQAVNAAGLQFQRTDANAPVRLSCQKNAVMLFTDGYSNNDGPTVGNIDGAMTAPFKDGHSDTMADIVSQYYLNPLRTDDNMPRGQVPVPQACGTGNTDLSLDCNKDLHINFYGITLGARGNLYDPNNQQNPYTTPAIYNNWPSRQNDNRSTVDDIWHAATNTRGEYINARTPADITAAMRRVLSSVTAGAAPSGSLALTGSRIGTGTLSVTPTFEVANQETDWFSRLTASTLTVNDDTRVAEYTTAWEAAAKMGTQTARNIVATKGENAVDFTNSNIAFNDLCTKPGNLYPDMVLCSGAEIEGLGGDIATAMAYLRGDRSREVGKTNGIYRFRSTVLGDIVNSSPVISSPRDDYGYQRISTDFATSYAEYLASKREDGRYMVYVGANDGMLHAFDGGMSGDGTTDGSGGTETFAYIPGTALGHMGNLLYPYKAANKNDQKFRHRYYVDGPITVADVQLSGSWATALVGTAGAGGRAVFGLDVTTPSTFGTTNRLWEISDVNTRLADDVRANIGHVLGKPVIVPVKSGTDVAWKAIFGNGYNSADGKAVLFVVDMADGAVRMITATEASNTAPAGTNGLGNIVVLDRLRANPAANPPVGQESVRGRDGLADTVYAADQRGALWKFDLEDSSNSVTVPVFTTARQTDGNSGQVYRQPITGGMTTVTGPGGGVMLLFGTGSFSFSNDPQDTAQQALYGVNDISAGQPTSTITPSNLVSYTVTTDTGGTKRSIEAASFTGGTAYGWTVLLPGLGERFVGNPAVAAGVVFLPTYLPNNGAEGCSTEGSNWLFGLNPVSGVAALDQARIGSPGGDPYGSGTAATSLNTGGTAPVKDVSVAVVPRLAAGGGPNDRACWMVVNVAGAEPMYLPYPCGRQSWRQIQ